MGSCLIILQKKKKNSGLGLSEQKHEIPNMEEEILNTS